MKLTYTISQDKDGTYYAHRVGFPNCPCMIDERHTFGTKTEALHNAAIMMCLPYKEYMQLRKGG